MTPTRTPVLHLILDLEDTPIRIQALYLVTVIKGRPSKTPGENPIRMPINSLLSRRASRGKYHNIPCSRIRSILRLSKEIFQSQPQHIAVRKSWKEIACLDMMMIETIKRRTIFHVECFQQSTTK